MTRLAFVTGVTGQDGSYLVDLLLEKGYTVYGLMRRISNFNTKRIEHVFNHPRLHLCYGDLLDMPSIFDVLRKLKNTSIKLEQEHPIEIYNLGAQSHVKVSFETPIYTAQADGIGTLNLLESIRMMGDSFAKRVRLCQASTSEMFGATPPPQSETTPFYPRSPYGVSKLFAYWTIRNYRESYGIFACNAISFNHESERRGETFVTRKITKAVAGYAHRQQQQQQQQQQAQHDLSKPVIELGNLIAERDWGHAADYVRGMWMLLQHQVPDDYVIATGTSHSVRDFVVRAFKVIGVEIKWSGCGMEEVGVDAATGQVLVRVNERYFRPAEVDKLLGDSTKLRRTVGWEPTVSFDELVKKMVDNDIDSLT